MPDTAARRRLGFALLAVVSLFWGCNLPILKIALAEIPLWQLRSVNGGVAAAILFALAFAMRETIRPPRALALPLLACSIANVTGWHLLIGYGVSIAGASQSTIIGYTMPIFQAVLGVWLLREPITPVRIVALAMASGAVLLLLFRGDVSGIASRPDGLLLLLGAALSWALGLTIQKRHDWRIGTFAFVGWQMAIGSIPIIFVAATFEPFVMHKASAAALASMLYTTLFASVLAYSCWFQVVKLLPTAVAAMSTLIVPIVSLVAAALLVNEPIGLGEIGAMLLVLGAVALVLYASKPARAAK